jgi:hypothetical protein
MQKIYRIYPAKVAPIIVAVVAICLCFSVTPWAFIALPFIYLGSICAAPNLNLADGFLVLISMILGLVVAFFEKEIGFIIIVGVASSWLLSAIEKTITAKPIEDEENGA